MAEQASGPGAAGAAIEDFLVEDRTFPPPDSFKADALVTGAEIYDEADADWQGFWARQAAELVTWYDEWHTILEWDLPFARWFVGGTLNVSYNCLDRHVEAGNGSKVAYHWEGEPGDTRTITYADLLGEVQRFANVLKGLGRRQGRPRGDLHADDPRAAGGHAGLRPHRGAALGGVRRVLGRLAVRPHQRRRVQGAGHRRRRVPAGPGPPAQAHRRRGAGRVAVDRARGGGRPGHRPSGRG